MKALNRLLESNKIIINLPGNGAISPHHQQVCSLLLLCSHCYILGNWIFTSVVCVPFKLCLVTYCQQLYTVCACFPQISLIVACIIGVIAYRLAVYASFASVIKDPMRKIQLVGRFITPQLATSVTASCINFVTIMILNFFYERVAIWITDMGKEISSDACWMKKTEIMYISMQVKIVYKQMLISIWRICRN